MNTLEVVSQILKLNADIEELNFVELRNSEAVQNTIRNSIAEKEQINKALEIRNEHHFSFWDSLCSTFVNNNNYSKVLLSNVFHHNYNKTEIPISRRLFPNIHKKLEHDKNYAIISRVLCKDKQIFHIPFIDFHCSSNEKNTMLATDIIHILKLGPGYLLDSGKSFHFIGKKLINESELTSYLGKLLMYNPIIDKSWIAHQLIEKTCALRIAYKDGVLPKVIKIIENHQGQSYTLDRTQK
jgi:hypothetical protein